MTQEELSIGIVLSSNEDEFASEVYLFPMKSEMSQSRLMTSTERAEWTDRFITYGQYNDEVSRMMDREPSFKGTGERMGFDMRGINESLNPEVSRAVDIFISKMADKYDYTMQDAVYAIMAALKQRNYDGLNESLNPEVGKELDEFLAIINKKYEYDYPHALDAIMAALEQQNMDTKYDMPGFGDTMDALDDISIREEEEMDDAAMDKAAAKSAKKGDSITATSNKLQKLTKKMKDKAKEFKAAEGEAKEKIKDELKKMTKEKKQLEKAL